MGITNLGIRKRKKKVNFDIVISTPKWKFLCTHLKHTCAPLCRTWGGAQRTGGLGVGTWGCSPPFFFEFVRDNTLVIMILNESNGNRF